MSDEKHSEPELAALLALMLAETGGPLTEAEQRAADEELGIPVEKRRD
jgi:hypothetical protein